MQDGCFGPHLAKCQSAPSRLIWKADLASSARGRRKAATPFFALFRVIVRSCGTAKEKTMNPTRIPGNEPDPGDMSTEPGTGAPNNQPENHDLPDEDAEKLGDFA